MQFKDTFRALILSAISCLIVFSCITVDKTIGSDNIPDEYQLAIKTSSFRLPVGMKMLDSLQGISDSYLMIGSVRTEEFGLAEFGAAGNIAPSSSNLNLGKDPVVISTYLSIPLDKSGSVNSSIILDPSQEGIPQTFNIHRLKVNMDSTRIYNNSIGENDYDHTPLNTSTLTYFGGDSIKVYLNNAFGQELISASEAELDSLYLFAANHKGLYIKCNEPAPGFNTGRINLFNKAYACVYVKLNFQPSWASGLARKDTIINFIMGYDHLLNTSSYSSQDLETDEAGESIYFEGIGGISPYISAHALKDTLDAWTVKNGYNPEKVVIAKASLVFPFELPDNLDIVPYTYPSKLFPTRRMNINDTSDIKYYYLFEDYNSSGNPMGAMNRSLMQYECDFSASIQKLIRTPKDELDGTYNIWLYPLMSVTDEYYGTTSYYIDNYSYYKAKLNGPKAARYPELKIVYAIIK